jgi:hypothetical protein
VWGGGMNVALLFFGCRRLKSSNGWESTCTSLVEASAGEVLVDASAGEVGSLDGGEAASHNSFW